MNSAPRQELAAIARGLREHAERMARNGVKMGPQAVAEVREPTAVSLEQRVIAAADAAADTTLTAAVSETLPEIRTDLGDCHRCKLAEGRKISCSASATRTRRLYSSTKLRAPKKIAAPSR